jgi:anti-anti-sigma factor
MKLSWEEHGPIALLIASGDFTTSASESFRRVVGERIAAGATSFVVDLANVTLADSAALESLLWLSDETARFGGQLRLVAPQDAVREALRLTRLTDRFECAETVQLAGRGLRVA